MFEDKRASQLTFCEVYPEEYFHSRSLEQKHNILWDLYKKEARCPVCGKFLWHKTYVYNTDMERVSYVARCVNSTCSAFYIAGDQIGW